MTSIDLTLRVLQDLAGRTDPRAELHLVAARFNLPASRIKDLVAKHGWPHPGAMGRAAAVLAEKALEAASVSTPSTVAGPPVALAPARVGRLLPIDKLVPHPSNPAGRVIDVDELASSIRTNGIMTPLVVTPHPNRLGHWLILAGHRRHAAALRLRLTQVPCVERDCSNDVDEQLVLMLVENVQRLDLNPMDKAEAFGVFLDRGMTHGQVEARTGVKVGVIRHYITLLDLDQTTRERVRAGEIGVMDAIAGVKKARGDARRRAGTPQRGRPVQLDPPWFGRRHSLADAVKTTCTHTTRPKIGAVGCGQCWEVAIRNDEHTTERTAP